MQTYGKPLPPSEGICYPRSSVDPNDLSLNKFSYGSIESPYGKGVDEPVEKPSNASKTATLKDQEQQSQGSGGDGNVMEMEQLETMLLNMKRGFLKFLLGGLEAMDLCESLFGYWPCLARAKRESYYRDCQEVCSKRSNDNCLWERTAEYHFGNSYPYGERWGNGGRYENPIYNYERH
ncbi:hypothetical protein CRYUN_Cryun32bG0028300 [Craigia yunnanensis]